MSTDCEIFLVCTTKEEKKKKKSPRRPLFHFLSPFVSFLFLSLTQRKRCEGTATETQWFPSPSLLLCFAYSVCLFLSLFSFPSVSMQCRALFIPPSPPSALSCGTTKLQHTHDKARRTNERHRATKSNSKQAKQKTLKRFAASSAHHRRPPWRWRRTGTATRPL